MGGAASVGSALLGTTPLPLLPIGSPILDADVDDGNEPSGELFASNETIEPERRYAGIGPAPAPMPDDRMLERRPSMGGMTMAASDRSVTLTPLGVSPASEEPPIEMEPDRRVTGCASNEVEMEPERCI